MTDKPYEKWLAERREVSPPATLADQIMSQVAELGAPASRHLVVAFGSADRTARGLLGGPCAAER